MDNRNDILKAMNGDNAAMERLYNATYPKLRAVTMSILKNEDDADDIVQDTYIKAFSSLDQLDDPEKFNSWLCRIASNKCKDYLKKHKPVLFSDMGSDDEDEDPYEWSIEDESGDYNPEEVAIADDTKRQLMEIINTLPDEQRICLVYFAVDEMKISEIAQMMETSESTIKSRLKYAKEKMKAKIEELEKKGVKIRGISGFALIPFLRYLFAMQAKSSGTVVPYAAVSEAIATATANAGGAAGTAAAGTAGATGAAAQGAAGVAAEGAKVVAVEVAKQAGAKVAAGVAAKTAVGLGAKIAAVPVATKIAAGVVAAGVAVSAPVVVHNVVTNNEPEPVENEYVEVLEQEPQTETEDLFYISGQDETVTAPEKHEVAEEMIKDEHEEDEPQIEELKKEEPKKEEPKKEDPKKEEPKKEETKIEEPEIEEPEIEEPEIEEPKKEEPKKEEPKKEESKKEEPKKEEPKKEESKKEETKIEETKIEEP